MKKRFGSVIMALLLVLSISTSAFAATATEADLRLTAEDKSGQTTVQVYLTAEGATNGKLEVTYKETRVALVSATVTDGSWMTSVNSETDGVVSLAWIGSDLPAEETCVLTLVFEVIDASAVVTSFNAKVTELYAAENTIGISKASDRITINVDGSNADTPDTPVITPPTPEIPTEPEDNDDPIDTPVDPVEPPVDPVEPPVEPDVPECPFTDIDNHWAEEEIIKAYQAGLVNGTSATTYEPDTNLTRASFITLLYRLAGAPAVEGDIPFTDVNNDFWYTNAIIWGYNNGIITGKTDSVFDPTGEITRQELALMLMRYAKYTGEDVTARADLDGFADADQVPDWSADALKWAVAEGIISGRPGNLLAPSGVCNRAEAAVILVRHAGL